MANYKLLNNIDHMDLKILIDRSAELGDDIWFSATFPNEFRNLQNFYPIVFTKNTESGEYQAVALFGFEEGENLFLDESGHGWKASYIPLNVMRMPFLIGFQEQVQDGQMVREPVITFDMDSPRVNREHGEALFLEHGGNSPYTEQVASILKVLQEGVRRGERFYEALVQHDLIESFVMDVELEDGSENRLSGFYTINEDALRELGGEALADLNRRGYLEAIYMVIASMGNLQAMVDEKNRRYRVEGHA